MKTWLRCVRAVAVSPCGRVRRVCCLVTLVLACGIFVLTCLTFNFPLTYCDSPRWAPGYFARLQSLDASALAGFRGWFVPAYFDLLGALSIRWVLPNLIGVVQAVATLAALVYLSRPFLTRSSAIEVILVPAFLASCLRYAMYSQTILSESVTLVLYAVLWRFVLGGVPTRAGVAGSGIAASWLLQARVDSVYMVPILLGKWLSGGIPWMQRLRHLRLGVVLFALAYLPNLMLPNASPGFGRFLIVSEWSRYTREPRNRLASALSTDLSRRLARITRDYEVLGIRDGIDVARAAGGESADWATTLKLLAYQTVNAPVRVIKDRFITFLDLFSASFSSFSMDYKPWGHYTSPFKNVFQAWPREAFDHFRYSCPEFGLAQAAYFRLPQIRSTAAFQALHVLYRAAGLYSDYLLRPLLYATLIAAPFLWWWSRSREYRLLTLIIAAHFALRAILICADERYELPIDMLCVWWAALTLRCVWDRLKGRASPSLPAGGSCGGAPA